MCSCGWGFAFWRVMLTKRDRHIHLFIQMFWIYIRRTNWDLVVLSEAQSLSLDMDGGDKPCLSPCPMVSAPEALYYVKEFPQLLGWKTGHIYRIYISITDGEGYLNPNKKLSERVHRKCSWFLRQYFELFNTCPPCKLYQQVLYS